MSMMHNTTLQINLSPGDVNYANLTVPALINHHRNIKDRLLVVDCCRPQKTKLVDPDTKYPLNIFQQNVERITAISEQFLKSGLVTDVYYLKPGDILFKHLSKKYLNGVYDCTHGAGGTANMGYWAGIELPRTKYVLHYDGDIILYQKPGYFWHEDALGYLNEAEDNVFATPRLCPPLAGAAIDMPSIQEGRPYTSHPGYWKNDWFSTRHFLADKEKLDRYLPLVRGKLRMELFVRKYGRRAFPLDPEIVLFRSLPPRGGRKITLKSLDAWITHPLNKPQSFLDILPQMISTVAEGKYPDEQRGHENIIPDAWINYLGKQS
jgi:hypothetical protein